MNIWHLLPLQWVVRAFQCQQFSLFLRIFLETSKSPCQTHKYPTNFDQCHWIRIECVSCIHSNSAHLVHNWILYFLIHNTVDRKCVDLWVDLTDENSIKLDLVRQFGCMAWEINMENINNILARSLVATVINAAIIKQMEITSILLERSAIITCSLNAGLIRVFLD